VWLAWNLALWAAAILALAWLGARRLTGNWKRIAAPLFKESALLFAIYACWIRLADFRVIGTEGAAARGRWIWHAERWLHLPNERTLQQWTMHATWLVRFANTYYIVGHVAPLGVFLAWLYIRHRDVFPRWRNQLAFVSIVGGLIQFIPVAPPRLYPEYGFIDTAARYGPRVYDSAGFGQPGQLAAMPSMHVAWALLLAIATVTAGRSRWRWLGPTHGALTVFAVTVTAYHWLLDGIVAAAILLVGLSIARLWDRRRGADRPAVSGAIRARADGQWTVGSRPSQR
jgi:hypothetical protein